MITVTLVKTRDGLLVGQKASDRWNLASLMPNGFKLYADRSQIAVKRLRRMFGGWGFRFVQLRDGQHSVYTATHQEVAALGHVLNAVCPGFAPFTFTHGSLGE